jgi:hypothetical protein
VNALRALLARPLGWFMFALAEYLVAIAVLRAVVPEDTPVAAGIAILVAVVAGLFAFNLWLRRRLAQRDR